jgi:hypothetical protein
MTSVVDEACLLLGCPAVDILLLRASMLWGCVYRPHHLAMDFPLVCCCSSFLGSVHLAIAYKRPICYNILQQ